MLLKFLDVKNPEIRKNLREFSWGQAQVTDASHFLVFAGKESIDENWIRKFIQRTATVRNLKIEDLKEYEGMMIGDLVKGPRSQIAKFWTQRQAYIAMGFLMETAALMKIDTCPMEGLDPSKYDELLNLKGTGWTTMAAVAIGYRADTDAYAKKKKVRFEHKDLFEVI